MDAAPGESELTSQLRSELIGALGRLGNDPATQARAAEFYATARKDPAAVDPNLLPALVAILAFIGDAARYDDFSERFKTAATPQEERRYLFSLAMFQQQALLDRTLAKTLNGEIRLQDAPFMVSAVMNNVYGREQGWRFVKTNWDLLDRRFPKQGLRRMCGGITGFCKPELERDVRSSSTLGKSTWAEKRSNNISSSSGSASHSANDSGAIFTEFLQRGISDSRRGCSNQFSRLSQRDVS